MICCFKLLRRIRDALQPLSLQGTSYPSSFETYADLIINVLPRHEKKNGGKEVLCLKSEIKPKNTKNTYKLTHNIIKINPTHA